jgi:hypothetical protein
MDITILAAWGEFIGGIAVVVSLVYLASQIRQNSRLLQASTTSASSQVEVTVNALMAQEPEVAKAYFDGLTDLGSLSEEDRRRFDAVASIWIQVLRQQHQFQRDGIGSPDEWTYRLEGMRWVFRHGAGARQWWREIREVYPERFREVVDGLIREGEAAG